MEKNYNRYFEQVEEVMKGVCYQKRSYKIAEEFELSKLEKINEMYFRKN